MNQQPSPQFIGWPLLVVPDVNGQLHYSTLEDSVRQAMQVILRTRPGEQLMHPEFGAGLENYLHEPNMLTTHRRIRDLIMESLARWEPRIIVDGVEVGEANDHPSWIRVEIDYRIRRTGSPQNMGITLALEG